MALGMTSECMSKNDSTVGKKEIRDNNNKQNRFHATHRIHKTWTSLSVSCTLLQKLHDKKRRLNFPLPGANMAPLKTTTTTTRAVQDWGESQWLKQHCLRRDPGEQNSSRYPVVSVHKSILSKLQEPRPQHELLRNKTCSLCFSLNEFDLLKVCASRCCCWGKSIPH